jgi:hypothetical protein
MTIDGQTSSSSPAAACARGEQRGLGFREEGLTEGAAVVGGGWISGGGGQKGVAGVLACM